MNGRSGITRITLFDPSRVASQVAGEIKDFDADTVMPKKEVRRNDRYVHFAWAAVAEAMADAKPGEPDRRRGAGLADRGDHRLGHRRHQHHDPRRHRGGHRAGIDKVGPFLVTAIIPDMAAGYVAIYANARGPNYATVSACSTANHAIGDSLNIIRRGDADVMIAGGAEAGIGEIPVAAFSAMRALSTKRNHEPEKASRPFDAERDGFIMADGAGILVLEELEHARARGATHPCRGRRLRRHRRRLAHHPARHPAGAARWSPCASPSPMRG